MYTVLAGCKCMVCDAINKPAGRSVQGRAKWPELSDGGGDRDNLTFSFHSLTHSLTNPPFPVSPFLSLGG